MPFFCCRNGYILVKKYHFIFFSQFGVNAHKIVKIVEKTIVIFWQNSIINIVLIVVLHLLQHKGLLLK